MYPVMNAVHTNSGGRITISSCWAVQNSKANLRFQYHPLLASETKNKYFLKVLLETYIQVNSIDVKRETQQRYHVQE